MANKLDNIVSNFKASIKNATLAATLATTLAACGGSPTGPSPGPNPTPVTQTVKVISSDGRDLGTTTYTANQGENLTITINSLKDKGINTDTIDPNYAALRENNNGDQLGNYVTNTTNGQLTFTPTNNTRILWAMNNTNVTDYGCAWNTGFGREGITTRYATVQRLTSANNTINSFQIDDNATTDGIPQALEMLNRAWTVNGIRYAQLSWTSGSPASNFKGGRGTYLPVPNAAGAHIGDSFIIRANTVLPIDVMQVSAEEAFEMFSNNADDLCGQDTTATFFERRTDSDITSKAKDYVRFVPLMSR